MKKNPPISFRAAIWFFMILALTCFRTQAQEPIKFNICHDKHRWLKSFDNGFIKLEFKHNRLLTYQSPHFFFSSSQRVIKVWGEIGDTITWKFDLKTKQLITKDSTLELDNGKAFGKEINTLSGIKPISYYRKNFATKIEYNGLDVTGISFVLKDETLHIQLLNFDDPNPIMEIKDTLFNLNYRSILSFSGHFSPMNIILHDMKDSIYLCMGSYSTSSRIRQIDAQKYRKDLSWQPAFFVLRYNVFGKLKRKQEDIRFCNCK
jgi:hypothetical protein